MRNRFSIIFGRNLEIWPFIHEVEVGMAILYILGEKNCYIFAISYYSKHLWLQKRCEDVSQGRSPSVLQVLNVARLGRGQHAESLTNMNPTWAINRWTSGVSFLVLCLSSYLKQALGASATWWCHLPASRRQYATLALTVGSYSSMCG